LRLALWGMMGTGKTTVGRLLSRFLGIPFLDLDREIVRRTGRFIPEIFREEGEEAFRRLEKETLLTVLERMGPAGLLSLGGGTLLSVENREALARAGFRVIVLDAPLAVLKKRLEGRKDRPLFSRIETLYHARREAYARYPQVDASASPRHTGAAVLSRLVLTSPREVAQDPHPVMLGDLELPEGGLGLTHPHLYRLWQDLLSGTSVLFHPPGERFKTLRSLERLARRLVAMGADRHTPLLVVGGGVLGDLGGLLGALFGRGMPVELVPTTLLAAVDAHIGGKTGVNLQGKNLLGFVRFPRTVRIDPRFFFTLPTLYWREGVVELLKVLALTRPDFPDLVDAIARDLRQPSYPGALEWIPRAVEAKLTFVRKDPFEVTGERFVLNLGHTFGHALEAASGFRIRHGMAVAWGMVMEARMGVEMGITPPKIPRVLEETFARLGVLPEDVPDRLADFLPMDKKRTGSHVPMPLLQDWGKPVSIPVSLTTLRNFLGRLLSPGGGGGILESPGLGAYNKVHKVGG